MKSPQERDEFFFDGRLPSSKSVLNRALILRSHSPELKVRGDSDAEDVIFLRKSLGKIEDGKEFYLGDGGTTLRFFALRAAREKGTFILKGSERLFRRPQGALKEILAQLGCKTEMISSYQMQLKSPGGWKKPEGALKVPAADSSQFASAVVLNAWDLPYDLTLDFGGPMTSESYFRMTLEMCRRAGLQFTETVHGLVIPGGQKITAKSVEIEPDISSLFSLASLAALNGHAKFHNLPEQSLQPDLKFVEFFREMGVSVSEEGGALTIDRAEKLRAISADVGDSPDLVPVLSVVCAFAEGRSVLHGAPQLRHKESNRITSAANLLRAMGVEVTERTDGLEIQGQPDLKPKSFDFNPDKDHRLAMAAGILNQMGWSIRVLDPDVVNKSFPEFWSVLHAGPHLLIGHRGAGKTSLLRRVGDDVVDLDSEIESRSGQAVFDLFRNRGEEIFRQWEVSTLKDLGRESGPHRWIALGAGLRLNEAEKFGEFFWLRRDTDHDGRVFLDRPRLDPGTDPLVEFRQRAKSREPLYAHFADRTYTMPEGLEASDEIERKILSGRLEGTGGVVTLFPVHRRTIPQLGARLYELRDDLLDPEELHGLFHKLPPEKVLYSVRKGKWVPEYVLESECLIDWGLDDNYPDKSFVEKYAHRLILSSHGSLKDAQLDFRLYKKYPVRLKMSPPVESFDDLKAGHSWWSQDPAHRHFLPRSSEGRWLWYRLWMKGRSAINFWREGTGSSLDQPTLYQWLATPWAPTSFAAVLGSPVHHSWSPTEHRKFFEAAGLPVFSIDVREGEWDRAFPFLAELGLRFAAVTAPLKGRAYRSSEPSKLAEELKSVNTLAWDGKEWRGHNTDLMGLEAAVHDFPKGPVAVWGGGGTLGVIGRVLPKASAFSSTQGHLRQGSKELEGPPSVVVWAAPRGPNLTWPPDHWKPEIILDLNYKEDSPGREYALRVKAKYISGETMFRAQAKGQKEFWRPFIANLPTEKK